MNYENYRPKNRKKLYSSILNRLGSNARKRISPKIHSDLYIKIFEILANQLYNQLYNQLRNQLSNQLNKK